MQNEQTRIPAEVQEMIKMKTETPFRHTHIMAIDDVELIVRRAIEMTEKKYSKLAEILHEIATGKGRFSISPFQHAINTIDDMKELAKDAIDIINKATGMPPENKAL